MSVNLVRALLPLQRKWAAFRLKTALMRVVGSYYSGTRNFTTTPRGEPETSNVDEIDLLFEDLIESKTLLL